MHRQMQRGEGQSPSHGLAPRPPLCVASRFDTLKKSTTGIKRQFCEHAMICEEIDIATCSDLLLIIYVRRHVYRPMLE